MGAVQITYTVVILLTKVSILLLYLRVFSPSRAVRITIHVNLWVNVAFYLAACFVAIFIYSPRKALWNPYIYLHEAKYLDTNVLKVVSAVVNLVSDIVILVIPISMVWTLQMQRKTKIRTIAIFATGVL